MSASTFPPVRDRREYAIDYANKRAWLVHKDGRWVPVLYQQAVGLVTLGLAREAVIGSA